MITIEVTLGKDPELKYSNGGVAYCKLAGAYTPWVKDVPPRERPTQWFNIVVFKDQAENVAESLIKGDKIIVSGRLVVDSWLDKQTGEQRTGLSITADSVSPSLRFASAMINRSERKTPASKPVEFADEEPF